MYVHVCAHIRQQIQADFIFWLCYAQIKEIQKGQIKNQSYLYIYHVLYSCKEEGSYLLRVWHSLSRSKVYPKEPWMELKASDVQLLVCHCSWGRRWRQPFMSTGLVSPVSMWQSHFSQMAVHRLNVALHVKTLRIQIHWASVNEKA